MAEFPVNFLRLHKGEESIRDLSIKAIESDADLVYYVQMIEKVMDILYTFIMCHIHENEDELALQCLGIRLFNSSASALKLSLSGYYQNSAQLLRDLLETTFLLDYFQTDKTLIGVWRACKENERSKEFAPAKIRKALDQRDGFTERKREAHYKLLCNMAAHPSQEGFRMLVSEPGGNASCRPFFELKTLQAVLGDFVKISMQFGEIFPLFFQKRTISIANAAIEFKEESRKWQEKYLKGA